MRTISLEERKLRQQASLDNKKKVRKNNRKRNKITPDEISENEINIFYILLKKEIIKTKHSGYYLHLTNRNNVVNNSKQHKFNLLKQCLKNEFYSKGLKEEFLNCFQIAQNKYHALNRLFHIYKVNNGEYRNTTDMLFETIDATTRNIIIVLEGTSKYLFRIHEINKIFKNALCNCDDYDTILPLPCKNPYNNNIFTKCQLINIYIQLLYSTQQIYPLITEYYNSGFNLKVFYKTNYSNINSQFITAKYNEVMHFDTKTINEVSTMLHFIDNVTYGDIRFPISTEVCNDMKPFLKLFYTFYHASDRYVKHRALQELKYRMKKVLVYNPNYGLKQRKKSNDLNRSNKQEDDEYFVNIERVPFKYNNKFESYDSCHECNDFVYNEEFPYSDRTDHHTYSHRSVRGSMLDENLIMNLHDEMELEESSETDDDMELEESSETDDDMELEESSETNDDMLAVVQNSISGTDQPTELQELAGTDQPMELQELAGTYQSM